MNPGLSYFTPQQWAALSYDQRDQILVQHGTKRNISAILINHEQGHEQNAYGIYGTDTQGYELNYNQPYPDDTYYSPNSEYYGNNFLNTGESVDQYQDYGGVAGNEFGQRSRVPAPGDDSRFIGMFHTSTHYLQVEQQQESRIISQLNSIDGLEGRLELDMHADTCTAGKNSRILSYINKVCQVSPYHPQ